MFMFQGFLLMLSVAVTGLVLPLKLASLLQTGTCKCPLDNSTLIPQRLAADKNVTAIAISGLRGARLEW